MTRATLLAILPISLIVGGCIQHTVRPCDDGTVCQVGEICGPAGGCSTEALQHACDGQAENTPCSATDPITEQLQSGRCRMHFCDVVVCGDNLISHGEACDDGNTNSGDGCSATCTIEGCGNLVLEGNEQCDDGNVQNGDGCQSNCQLPFCGDAVMDPTEDCDLGIGVNSAAPDAVCRLDCTPRRCGDNVIDPLSGELCDDGNVVDGDGCKGDCSGP